MITTPRFQPVHYKERFSHASNYVRLRTHENFNSLAVFSSILSRMDVLNYKLEYIDFLFSRIGIFDGSNNIMKYVIESEALVHQIQKICDQLLVINQIQGENGEVVTKVKNDGVKFFRKKPLPDFFEKHRYFLFRVLEVHDAIKHSSTSLEVSLIPNLEPAIFIVDAPYGNLQESEVKHMYIRELVMGFNSLFEDFCLFYG